MTDQSKLALEQEPNCFKFNAVGIISTPFKQKFGIPRQSQSLSAAKGAIQFSSDINPINACRGLEQFSHLWISFIFHKNIDQAWTDTVRPPRLGGNQKVGVFASRSTFRPNPIGLSVVKNLGLNEYGQLIVEGVDLLDQTPIIDIKPYIAYADSVADARSGFASEAPSENMATDYSAEAFIDLNSTQKHHPEFRILLENILSQDPRPAYKSKTEDAKEYNVLLFNYDIKWQVRAERNFVLEIRNLGSR
jgi:tRNA-Thr(GGU) m(6)t(6)A37 methyltransferase TsaA